MKNYLFCNIFFCIITISSCCKDYEKSSRVYFTIKPENRQIIIPVHFNDSILASMIFDTGWGHRGIGVDSLFIAMHPHLIMNMASDTSYVGSSWGGSRVSNKLYPVRQTISINTIPLMYNGMNVFNLKKSIFTEADGILNIPEEDSTHVWELNFEHNYLEIHSATGFRIPEFCFLFHMGSRVGDIQFPLRIQRNDKEVLVINDTFFIDVGMPQDIALMHPNKRETDFFNAMEDVVWTRSANGIGYNLRYNVTATLFDNFVVDSLRIYFFDSPHEVGSKYLLGLNFLKRFNVFFDMKNRQVGFQPIKNFQRIINPNHRRFYFSTEKTTDGRFVVGVVADYKSNPYKIAGLQEGDEIISFNEKQFKNLTVKDGLELDKADTLKLGVIRKSNLIEFIIPVDKDKDRGD